jgi:hypothetical protein
MKNYKEEWEEAGLSLNIPTYGSWKDIFLLEKPTLDVLNWLMIQLEENPNANLIAKYFPRKGEWFSSMHKYLGLTPKQFRDYIVDRSNTVEQKICAKEWSAINYSSVPSVAMNKYRMTFIRKDGLRFNQFNEDVLAGKTKVNASVLFPHTLFKALVLGEDETAVEAQWQSLPNYMANSTERILPVCDVSGSMLGLPMDVSVSLGLYIAERNKSIFKNAFITFSNTPTMQYVQGTTLKQKFESISNADWEMNTNLEATFKLILNKAVMHSLTEDEMPTKLLIISDMEFDQCESEDTNLENIKLMYNNAGYKMPEIIFWNVEGRVGNIPASMHDTNVGLVSGFSPSILSNILKGEVLSPEQLMLDVIMNERYNAVDMFIH